MSDVLLLPSPLLGPTVWGRVAELFGARVADARGATTPEGVLAEYERAAEGLSDPLLVPHSNAGLYAPLLAERVGARATVYVDAALPESAGEVALAPPRFLDFLTGLADRDGVLPPWTEWWDEVGDLFPDARSQELVEAEQPRLPLSYFTERVPVPERWAERPSGYLAFGETYAAEVAFAAACGWPVTRLPGRHLHQLVAPKEVAAAVADLAVRLTGA